MPQKGLWFGLAVAAGSIIFITNPVLANASTLNLTVNTTADGVHPGACASGTANQCTVREAVIEANANAGTDNITVPAGTYTLTLPKVAGDYSGNHGALYITDSVNITGAGQASTIIEAGTNATNGVDMVMSVNEDINPLSNASANISNLTLKFGRNTGTHGNDGDGGCMEFDTGTSGNAQLTLDHVTLDSCSTTQGEGGGIAIFNFLKPTGTGGVTITNSIIENNSASDNVSPTVAATGGGIWVSIGGRLTISNSQIINNNATQVSGDHSVAGEGGGITITTNVPGNPLISIHNSMISGNHAAGNGGGVHSEGNLLIDTGSVISNNVAGTANLPNATGGGGLWLNAPSQGCPGACTDSVTLSHVTITGNSATGNGGGIFTGNLTGGGNLTMNFSRVAGNTAPLGANLTNIDTTVNGTDNWWGTNTPATTISTTNGGISNVDPWINLTHTPAVNPILLGSGTDLLTATFAKDNHGAAISAANLDRVIGLPIAFNNAVLGTVTSTQTSIQSSGSATAVFTPTGAGTGHADAVVDSFASRADITIIAPDLTVQKTNSLGTASATIENPFNWILTVTNAGTATSTFGNGNQQVLIDTLPAGPSASTTYGTPTVVNGSGVSGSMSCSITSNVLTCTSGNGANNLSIPAGKTVTVTIPVTAHVVGSITNPTGGSCNVDPSNVILESNTANTGETNNNCNTNTVNVTAPDLTVSQSDSLSGGNVIVTVPFNWILLIKNSGTASANFGDLSPNGATVLSDALPATGASFGTTTATTTGGVTGTIACSITSGTLNCLSGNGANNIHIPVNGTVKITIPVTPTAIGSLTNPAASSTCSVDPANKVPESSESNNVCNTDVVTVVPIPAIDVLPVTLPSATATVSYAQTLTASTTATSPFTWSIATGTLPAGITLNTSAHGTTTTISGTTSATGTFAFGVNVTNVLSSATASYSLIVNPAPPTTNNLNVVVSGLQGTDTTGILLNDATATALSTSTTVGNGTTTFALNANDVYSLLVVGPAGYTSTVGAGCSGTLATTTECDVAFTPIPPTGTTSTLNVILNVSGGTATSSDFTVTITGANPTLNNFPGSASGTVLTVDGGTAFSVAATTTQPGYTPSDTATCHNAIAAGASATCTITETFSSATSTPTSTTDLLNITVSGLQGSDTTGILLNDSTTNALSTSTNVGNGTLPFTLNANDAYSVLVVGPAGYTFTVGSGCSGTITATTACDVIFTSTATTTPTSTPGIVSLNIPSSALPSGQVNTAYTSPTITATNSANATDIFTFGVASGTLPTGLTLTTAPDNLSASIAGTPTTPGVSTFEILATSVSDPTASANATYSITIDPAPAPTSTATSTLNVALAVDNSAGGTATSSDFTVTVLAGNPAPATFPGSASGTAVTVDAATPFSVNVAGLANYTESTNGLCADASGIIANSSVNCAITETFTPPAPPAPTTPLFPNPTVVGVGSGTGVFPSSNSNGSGGTSSGGGVVLGASTSTVTDPLAFLQMLLLQLKGLEKQLVIKNAKASSCSAVFDRNLSKGMTHQEVLALQKLLNLSSFTQVAQSGAGSPNNETTHFGDATKNAVVNFQNIFSDEILAPASLTAGNGFVGAGTRAELNALCTR